jgi:hypothetical protein
VDGYSFQQNVLTYILFDKKEQNMNSIESKDVLGSMLRNFWRLNIEGVANQQVEFEAMY